MQKVKRIAKAIIFPFAWKFVPFTCRHRSKKHILLASNRDKYLMSGCLGEYYNLLKKDPGLSFSVTTVENLPEIRASTKHWSKERKIQYVSFLQARLMHWDMIIAADHHVVKFFNPKLPSMLIPHGISSGKLFRGEHYKYLRNNIQRPDGSIIYSRILESTQSIYDDVCSRFPWLSKIVTVVGSLQADNLLAQKTNSRSIRKRLGFKENDIVILIMSTFGEFSLMETIGKRLIEQCHQLIKDNSYKFILTTHPHHWSGEYSKKKPYGEFLLQQEDKGFTIIKPDLDWAPYLIASDMAITDHTSLAIYFALLQKPMLMVKVPGATLAEGTPSDELLTTLPHLRNINRIKEEIHAAYNEFSKTNMTALIKKFHSYPGQAAARMKKEFYETLRKPDTKHHVNTGDNPKL